MKIFEKVKNGDVREVKLFGKTIHKYKKDFTTLFLSQMFRYQFDITNVPPASGIARDIQLANLLILKEIDRVCKKCNVKYWAAFGTLLGAVRHKGFIPWDDDIDLAMMRDDYEKFIELFNSETKLDLYAEFFYINDCNIIKVKHKTIKFIGIDIFVHDLYNSKIENANKRCEITNKLKKIQKDVYLPKSKKLKNNEEKYKLLRQLDNEMILEGRVGKVEDHPDVYLGLDFYSSYARSVFFNYDDVFPLNNLSFEDMEVPVPNNPDGILTYIYRDYMAFPSRLTQIHLDTSKLSIQEIEDVKKFNKQQKN